MGNQLRFASGGLYCESGGTKPFRRALLFYFIENYNIISHIIVLIICIRALYLSARRKKKLRLNKMKINISEIVLHMIILYYFTENCVCRFFLSIVPYPQGPFFRHLVLARNYNDINK